MVLMYLIVFIKVLSSTGDTVSLKDMEYRNNLDKALGKYVAEHYPEGVSTVYYTGTEYKIYIVGNKHNLSNFW
jgi:hypothetical protein